MKIKPIVLDYETMPIGQRPKRYPPEPTSFSLKLPEWRAPKFYAWGQKTGGNNCSKADAKEVLHATYKRVNEETPLLCHHAKFDLDISEEHFGLRLPPWHCYHDTMFLLFLEDPHSKELGLKPSAARLLGMEQEERDAVEEWILEHKKELERDFPEIIHEYGELDRSTGKMKGIAPSTAGRYIGYAPGSVVGPYANGDVTRTLKLFEWLHKRITVERGMGPAYDRERKIMPIFLASERRGIKVDLKALERDQPVFEAAQAKTDAWLRKALKAPTLDLDKDAEVAKALDAAGAVTQWKLTATGRNSTSKKNMKFSHFADKRVAAAYFYRQKCATMLETFIRPWRHYGASGRMHTTWNQVRQIRRNDTGGTRTGRPSSDTPNFLNMPKKVREGEVEGFVMPTFLDVPEPPKVRSYILPYEKGHVVGRRDFNQQEFRILAHFEDDQLKDAYIRNPKLDIHEYIRLAIQELINEDVGRPVTKTINFGYIYGQGVGSLAEKLDRTVEALRALRAAQERAVPGLKELSKGIKARVAQGLPIVTWGGREYYCEEPSFSEKYKRVMTYEYKLINYLCQGSAADVTKESIIRYEDVRKDGEFMLTVYDENDIDVPKKALKSEMLLLRDAMMSIELDVPLLSDGEWGPTLGDLQDLKEPAPDLSKWSV